MIKLHHIFRLVFGFAMVEFCRFFYYYNYNPGPSYQQLTPSAPSLSAEQQKLLGITPSSKYTGLSQIGNQNLYLSGNQVWQQDNSGNYYLKDIGTDTRFKRYGGDVKGLIKEGEEDARTYTPSMAYLSALQRAQTPYVPFSAQQAPLSIAGYNPSAMSSVYTPATSTNLLGNLPTGPMYGAGRFLTSGSGLLNMPISFTPSGNNTSNNSGSSTP